jgi:hypothetical protein
VLVLLLAVAAGAVAYAATQLGTTRTVQLREEVTGNAEQALEELRSLIRDNTR